ncbi:IS66 family transposase [Vibrio mediterranei]|uniref:IS66 family transposase n=1 Tax=Vibrio mediterranei TaxID=689 RepID=UPI0040676DDF
MGQDRSENLEFTPAVLKVLEYVRPKYACRQCEQTEDKSRIVQKQRRKALSLRTSRQKAFLGKYQYAMPLYRQESLFAQSGIELSRTTMARWIIQVSERFAPLYAALKSHQLEQVVVQTDGTPPNVLKEDKQCYMWLYCSGADSPEAALHKAKNIALYDYQNSRVRACSVAFLRDYSGYLQTDGYGAYDGLHQVTNVGCLARARCKFMDTKKLQGKGKSGKADKALAKIHKLYGIESRLKGAPDEKRKVERQQHTKPILDELYEWMTTQQVIVSSPLGKATKYTLGQWPKLMRYIDNGHLSIDNNRAERANKPLVIGSKKWVILGHCKWR